MINFLDKYPFVMTAFLMIIWIGATAETLITGFKTFKEKGKKVYFRLVEEKPAEVYLSTDRGGKVKINSKYKFTVSYNETRHDSTEFSEFAHLAEFGIEYAGKFELLEGNFVHAEITANNGDVEIVIPKSLGEKISATIVASITTIMMGIAIGVWLNF